mgnify:CR=1 FL=1
MLHREITRYGDRKQYAKCVIKQGIQGAVIFSIIHEMVSIVFLNVFGNIRILTAHGWIYGIIFQIIVNTLFYMQIYMVCKIIELRISEEKYSDSSNCRIYNFYMLYIRKLIIKPLFGCKEET